MIALFLRSYPFLLPDAGYGCTQDRILSRPSFYLEILRLGLSFFYLSSIFLSSHLIRVHYNAFKQLNNMGTWQIYVISWQMANTGAICLVSGTLPS